VGFVILYKVEVNFPLHKLNKFVSHNYIEVVVENLGLLPFAILVMTLNRGFLYSFVDRLCNKIVRDSTSIRDEIF